MNNDRCTIGTIRSQRARGGSVYDRQAWDPDKKIWTIPYNIKAVESLLRAYQHYDFECDERLDKELSYKALLDRRGMPLEMVRSSAKRDEWNPRRRKELYDELME